MYNINRLSLSHPKLLSFSKRNDYDKNDVFYSHANETYYHKKDLHLALLRLRRGFVELGNYLLIMHILSCLKTLITKR